MYTHTQGQQRPELTPPKYDPQRHHHGGTSKTTGGLTILEVCFTHSVIVCVCVCVYDMMRLSPQ